MKFLLILFLYPNFVLANEKINELLIEEATIQKIDNIQVKEVNTVLSKDITLKNIPRIKIPLSEKNSLRKRNPFFPPGSNNLNSKSGIKFANINIKGIAKIGDSKVVFMETSQGTNAYEIGQSIGGGYAISNIDEDKLLIKITNQGVTHSIKFEKDEK